MSFQRVFERLSELQRETNARGGKGVGERERHIQWKPVSEFVLRDELSNEEIFEVETLEPLELEDEEEEYLAENVISGLQAIMQQHVRIVSDAEKLKWFSVTWPSSLADTFR